MHSIKIENANEGNLKNVSLAIPKNKLVVFTGVSGSGKSTLLIDVLFNECQRQYLEALSLQGIHKPKVDRILGVSPAVVISQTDTNKNPRSTVGTVSNIYTNLRMIYEKLGTRTCPHCGKIIMAADCKEETEKIGKDFYVYMYCCECGKRMNKITRTHFSFNTKEGACPACEGLGKIHTIRRDQAVNEQLSLEDGAVTYWEKKYGEYQISVLYASFKHYGIPVPANTPVHLFSEMQKAIFYDGIDSELVKKAFPDLAPPKTVALGKYEGALPILWRRFTEKNGEVKQFAPHFTTIECPECKGERLAESGRNVTVNGMRLPQLSLFSLEELFQWIQELGDVVTGQQKNFVEAYLLDIRTKLSRFINVGLGYLSLDRQTVTLSGGEMQRLRLAAVLDSDLSGVIYILDEPTVGLHPKDTAGLMIILQKLRDQDNTVLVIEHDVDTMKKADYIIDIGPGSGKYGGRVVAAGTFDEIKKLESSVTGSYLMNPPSGKASFRKPMEEAIQIRNADKYNLQNINVSIPLKCLTAITGPSGSGKSTLIFEVLAKGLAHDKTNQVSGLEQFDSLVEIDQSAITKMKRSNVATYSEVYSEIRTLFSKTDAAKKAGFTAKHFSFNTPGGRCENCEGLGYVDSNMLFFSDIQVVCPVCNGNQFHYNVLDVKYKGLSIKDVLNLSVEEAANFFLGHTKITKILNLLLDVGLGYLELGQTLTTLSGGEGQRLKLAKELIGSSAGKHNLYLLDEPTTGLHPKDVEHFLVLLNRMVDAGNTVVVVEHNTQIIRNCDWVIDLGPEGGTKGGNIIFTGTPIEMKEKGGSITGKYL